MAQPVLVRAYTGKPKSRERIANASSHRAAALPPVASFAFADILKSADSSEFQHAIDGIAEIAAKNKMSLADEYASHLPPLGEITAATSSAMRPHLLRPGGGVMRRALTSVPEASSGSSEGSRQSKKRVTIFGFKKRQAHDTTSLRWMRISNMGRTVPVDTTTALTASAEPFPEHTRNPSASTITVLTPAPVSVPRQRTVSAAQSSLQRLLIGHSTGQAN